MSGIVPRSRHPALLAASILCFCTFSYSRAASDDGEPPPVTQSQLTTLIDRLGDEDYFVRERAQEALSEVGFAAFDALGAAQLDDDLEIAERARYLLRRMQIDWVVETDDPEVKRLLRDYEDHDERSRLAVVGELSGMAGDHGVPMLCRLVRFERSPLVSRAAALAVVDRAPPDEKDWQALETTIRDGIGTSPRAAAEWLRAFLLSHDDPAAGAARWGELAAAESQTLIDAPRTSTPSIAKQLWRQQVALLKSLGRRDEAAEAMMKIVSLEDGDGQSLGDLIAWLTKEQAWSVLDDATVRFANRFEQDAVLLYMLAEAQRQQGAADESQATVDRARALVGANSEDRLPIASELQQRGLVDWAEQEYRDIIEHEAAGNTIRLWTQFVLAEMLHDRADDEEAARVLDEAVVTMKELAKTKDNLPPSLRSLNQTRARAHHFYACHYEAQGDRAKQLSHLTEALAADPMDVDVLISLHHHPDVDPQLRERTRALIKQTADEYRRQIRNPGNEQYPWTPYNQLAWLIANTEGDFDEALRASQDSLKMLRKYPESIRPSSAGYLDTLARCYYAKSDYENAVKYQEQAVELEPHSGLMQRQLETFRKALEANARTAPDTDPLLPSER